MHGNARKHGDTRRNRPVVATQSTRASIHTMDRQHGFRLGSGTRHRTQGLPWPVLAGALLACGLAHADDGRLDLQLRPGAAASAPVLQSAGTLVRDRDTARPGQALPKPWGAGYEARMSVRAGMGPAGPRVSTETDRPMSREPARPSFPHHNPRSK